MSQEGQPEDLQERKNWPWWKVSKWALNIVYHLFSRYGSSKKHTKGSNEYQFYERWQMCSTQFLEDHMAIAIRLMQASFFSEIHVICKMKLMLCSMLSLL